MGLEYELKFRATPMEQEKIRQDIAGPEQQFSMHTTYYDTEDGLLAAKKYTLRKRMENDTAVCTLKAPAQGFGRGEWELCCDSIEQAIPELCKLGCPQDLPQLVQSGLVEVCGAKFQRIAKTVVLEDCTLEIALDLGHLMGGGKRIPLCEVEVELKEGSSQGADRYAKDLAEKYGLTPEKGSKFRRALALSKGE